MNSAIENNKTASFGEKTYESIPVLNLLTNLEGGKVKVDKEGVGAAGELGAYLIPGNKLLKGEKFLQKVAGGAIQGGEIGALLGATDPEAENLEERAKNTAIQGAIGTVTGGAVQGLFEVGKAGIKALAGDASGKLRKIIRPTPKNNTKFKRNTGWDYADEIVKRDAKEIEGMGYEQLEPYFKNKYIQATKKTDKILEASGKSVKKDWLQQQFIDVLEKYKDRPMVKEQVDKTFTTYFDALAQYGDDIPLSVANNIKRDLQELARASYSGTSGSVPKAYSKVASRLNKEIKRIVPKVINPDKETQLYKLVSDAVSNTSSVEANKISTSLLDKLLQTIPLGLGAGVGFGTGSLSAGVGTALLGAGASKAREIYRSPQVQTTLASKISAGVNPKIQALSRVLEEISRKGTSIATTK
jgi:hypothetical protein